MARINPPLKADIKSNLVTRFRAIGKTRAEIEHLMIYIDVSLDDVNDLGN